MKKMLLICMVFVPLSLLMGCKSESDAQKKEKEIQELNRKNMNKALPPIKREDYKNRY